jgi:hypothetical protein
MSPQKPYSLESRITDHEERIDDLEARLGKYDAIVTRLDVFIEMLSKHLEDTSKRVDDAIDGQGVLKERNEQAHRMATFAIGFASSVVTGVLVAVVIYVWPLLIR